MLRTASRLRSNLLRVPGARSYSEGFEISKYLSRIEAITKRGPITHKKSQQQKPKTSGQARGPSTGQPKQRQTQQRSAQQQQQQQQRQQRQSAGNQQQRRTAASPKQPRPAKGSTENNVEENAARPSNLSARTNTNRERAPRSAATQGSPAVQMSADEGWTSLDSETDTKPLPRSGRRPPMRKPNVKGKAPKKQQRADAKKPSKPKPSPAMLREYTPFLTPKEGLEIVLRNEGTSSGGFIAPIDVSLSSLQPNLVDSAVSYNSRVRSLLNSVSEDVANDREQLKKLTDMYVSGVYDRTVLDANSKSMSYQALASEVLSNHSMDPEVRKFFAQVGSGKLSPKQILSAARS